MTSEQIAELRQWCADSDAGMGDGADADREGVMLDTPVLKQLLDEREALLAALKNIQWAGVAGEASHFQTAGCPECEAEGEEERKHRQGCKVAAALAKAESP